jgi:type 1 glutamine amidotransferase
MRSREGSVPTAKNRKLLRASPCAVNSSLPVLALEDSIDTISRMIFPTGSRNGHVDAPTVGKVKAGWQASALLCFFLSMLCAKTEGQSPVSKPPLKALFIDGGGYHDYEKLTPHLTGHLAQLVKVTFEARSGLDVLRDPKFAEKYDVVVYDLCFDEAPDDVLENAIQAARNGKPTVMIHCAVHAFRHSPKIREWETCCGMRSKVHDPYSPLTVMKLDQNHPITKAFPENWKTPGDELYQTISIDPQSIQLLKVKSPRDGREHVVCWTYQFGQGRVFATTLGLFAKWRPARFGLRTRIMAMFVIGALFLSLFLAAVAYSFPIHGAFTTLTS